MYSEPSYLVVDIQGFQYGRGGNFIVKELAAVCLQSRRYMHVLFKPPKPFKKLSKREQSQYRWLEGNYLGGIRWSDGYADLNMLPSLLRKMLTSCTTNKKRKNSTDMDTQPIDDVYILCKGSEKKTILQSYIDHNDMGIAASVVDLDDYRAYLPDIESLHTAEPSDIPTCLFHNCRKECTHCALKNVWYICNILSCYNLRYIL